MLLIFVGRVSADDTLFYNPGRRRRRQTSLDDFVPIFFDELANITDTQRLLCEGNQQCIFDLAVTGDMDFAMHTLDHQKEANETKDVLSMFVQACACYTR